MGMYDNVEYRAKCFKCGNMLTDWQSKDGECELATIKPHEVERFYTSCPECGFWNEYRVKPAEVTIVPYDELEDWQKAEEKSHD